MGRQTRAAAPEKTARVLRPRSYQGAASVVRKALGRFLPRFPSTGDRSHLGFSRRRPSRVRRNGRKPRSHEPPRIGSNRCACSGDDRRCAKASSGDAHGSLWARGRWSSGLQSGKLLHLGTSSMCFGTCDSHVAAGQSSKRASRSGSPCSMGRVVSMLAASERPHDTPLGSSVITPSQGAR